MNFEENRLCTFDKWPLNAPVNAKKLAKEGFFATGRFLEVECFWCKSRIASWVYGDQVEDKHRDAQPQCPFLISRNDCNNIPILEPQLSESESAGCSSTVTVSPSESLYIEANRLATFKNWPNPNISPESLAKAGFYYLNRSDEAKCAWCKGVIAKWEKNDNAFNEHQRFFPHCPRVQLGPLIEMASDGIRDLGIQHIVPPKEPKYSSLDARIRTFEKWPIPNIQDPMALAQAGLYYQNISDQVRCFHCNIGLRSWQKEDNPWFEHAKWYPDCQFVRLVKSPKYVENVLKASEQQKGSDVRSSAISQPISIAEAMCTQPVRQALEMGIDAGSIRNITQKQLSRKGQPFLSVDELIQAVFDDRHEQQEEQESEEASENTSNNLPAAPILPTIPVEEEFNLPSAHLNSSAPDLLPLPSSTSSVNYNNTTDDRKTPPLTSICAETSSLNITNSSNVSLEECLPNSEAGASHSLEEENRKLKDARLCKVCLDEEVGVVFLPCGHLVTCVQCAPGVTHCPMCRTEIKGYVRAFLS